MNPLGWATVFVVSAASAPQLETRAAQHLIREFERVGRSAPSSDSSLARAAAALGRKALESSAAEAAEMAVVSAAVAEAGGYDPGPRALIIRGSPPDHALQTFLARTDLNEEPASRMGVAAVIDGERAAIVALLTERKVELKPFPRTFSRSGASAELCGELLTSLHSPSTYVTRPNGRVERVPLTIERGGEFCAKIRFSSVGRSWVEVMSQGRQGPEVAALFSVDTGAVAGRDESAARHAEPSSRGEAQRAIIERINAVRKIYGVSSIEMDPALNAIAQAYSEQMDREKFFAHVAPDGSDLRSRLQRAGYAYRAAAENLGLAAGPIAAHFGIERSPGHRRNLIEGAYTRIGIGVVFANRAGRAQAIVTEVFATPRVATTGGR